MSAIFRTSALRTIRVAPRAFSTTVRVQKSALDPVKDAAKTVDKTVSQAAIKGLEVGETATEKAKAAVGMDPKKDAQGNMEESATQASASAKEMSGEAKGKGQEMMGEAKGKAEELKGKAKGTAEEVKAKM